MTEIPHGLEHRRVDPKLVERAFQKAQEEAQEKAMRQAVAVNWWRNHVPASTFRPENEITRSTA